MCDDKMGSCGREGGCGCGGHGGSCGGFHKSWLWWLIAVVVAIIVFCAGYKLGVLRGYFGGWGYGYGPMQQMMYGDGWGGMMRGWKAGVLSNQVSTTVQK